MPTFGIDASSAMQEKKTGVHWYAHNLIQAMKAQPLQEGEQVVLYSPAPLEGELGVLPEGWENRVLRWPLPGGWMQVRMSWELLRRAPDVFFVPAKALPRITAKKSVNTIHDLGFLRQPNLWDASGRRALVRAHKRSVKKASHLLTPSEFTKRELIELYKVSRAKISVTPLAVNQDVYQPAAQEQIRSAGKKYRIGPHYFLFIGRWEKKKNVDGLIRAFAQFKADRGHGDPYELVLVGKPGYGFEEIERYFDYSSAKEYIKAIGYVDGSEAAALLSGAAAYVMPSWYEGFGLTTLEAMACGAPVIASDIPPHREVCGDAAIFVPPAEAQALARKFDYLVENPEVRTAMAQQGRERAQGYTWERTATLSWEALRSLV